MAQQYGGKFSPPETPDNARDELSLNKFRGRKVAKSNIRVKLLFLAPLPLIFKAFGAEPIVMGQYLLALALLLFAAWLTGEGVSAQDAYDSRRVARPPMIPRKLFGSILTGLGLLMVGIAGHGFIDGVIFGAIGFATHLFAFGMDPMRKKGMEGVNEFEAERVAKAVEKGERLLSETLSAAARFGDRKLEGRVESLASAARDMFRTVEEDPRDLTAARKFMGVYLKGARDATIKFADLYSKTKDAKARADYEALLADLERSFAAQRKTMLLENRTDLDVEIEVLRDRLKQEGLRARL